MNDQSKLNVISDVSQLWSIYMIIANLNDAIIRQRLRSSVILLSLISISADEDNMKTKFYHRSMKIMLCRKLTIFCETIDKLIFVIVSTLKQYAISEISIRCADDKSRKYHSILVSISIDYSKLTLITSVKNKSHCSICMTSDKKFENLHSHEHWFMRSHQASKD